MTEVVRVNAWLMYPFFYHAENAGCAEEMQHVFKTLRSPRTLGESISSNFDRNKIIQYFEIQKNNSCASSVIT
jgi:hypothetical protein